MIRLLQAIFVFVFLSLLPWRPAAASDPSFKAIFQTLAAPQAAPEIVYTRIGSGGVSRRLAEDRGHWVLINLWATWCVPCLVEMPSLDRLQQKMGAKLVVLPLSEDLDAENAVPSLYRRRQIANLPALLDPEGQAKIKLKAPFLPTSYLVDPQGRLVGSIAGGVDWESDEVKGFLRSFGL